MTSGVLIVDRTPHVLMNGVARYMIQLAGQFATHAGPPDVRILCHGRALRPRQWLERHRPPRPVRRWFTPLAAGWLQPIAQRLNSSGVIHYPYHNLPERWHVGRQQLLLTIHGAAAMVEETWGVAAGRAETIRRRVAAAGARLAHVITVSRWAAGEIERELQLDPARITAIHHGVDHDVFHPRPDQTAAFDGGRYVLHVGPCAPRKNVGTLVEAFAQLRGQGLPHRLLLVGRHDADRRALLQRCVELGIADAVGAPGVVGDRQLAELYRRADCFVFPSLYEGFGMPVLEAMACGTPVITSGLAALPEVAGDAAVLLPDPRDAAALAAALRRVLEDAAWRHALIQRGLDRARQFTWPAAAEQHLNVYRSLL